MTNELSFQKVYPADKQAMSNRVALLITNIKFTNNEGTRHGAEEDEENMEKLLKGLGYEVVKYTDLTGEVKRPMKMNECKGSGTTRKIRISRESCFILAI